MNRDPKNGNIESYRLCRRQSIANRTSIYVLTNKYKFQIYDKFFGPELFKEGKLNKQINIEEFVALHTSGKMLKIIDYRVVLSRGAELEKGKGRKERSSDLTGKKI